LSILTEWEITPEQLTELLAENPSLRGMLLGYVAEMKLKELVTAIPGVTYTVKHDDHNRKKKGDLYLIYRGKAFDLESKSLQSSMVRWDEQNKRWVGKAQVDGNDRRTITLPDGSKLSTTLLVREEFDVLAINCYALEAEWRFVFARNRDLPTSNYRGYTEEQKQFLLASLIPVTWPPERPFYADLKELLDEMIANGEGTDPATLDLD
jgi:hypothetical protein